VLGGAAFNKGLVDLEVDVKGKKRVEHTSCAGLEEVVLGKSRNVIGLFNTVPADTFVLLLFTE